MNRIVTRYRNTLAGVTDVAERVPAERWQAPSPCPGWTALHVLGHLIDGQQQIAALITGQGRREPRSHPMTAVAGEPVAAWAAAAAHMNDLLTAADPTAVALTHDGTMTVEQVLATAAIEPLVHAWDLAQAAGIDVTLDPEAVDACLTAIAPMAEQFAATGMYAPARPAPADAPPQQRLLALLGRDGTVRAVS
ncbi:MAG: TIGR03086 family protein [Streptosporangiales bacterium]|nr:TIGR03086 family protein [Streptosporangiales bacterium]